MLKSTSANEAAIFEVYLEILDDPDLLDAVPARIDKQQSAAQAWRAMVAEVQAELGAPQVDLGIMIEVPSAALMADAFAQEVDFFSVDTNDLAQYTLAMDRMHPSLAAKSDGLHPAVLRLIERTVEAAHAAGKWVGVCGELGVDPQAVPILIGLGVDELSVSVPANASVKAQIRSLTLSDAQL
jgi:phosphocarrier protein FPr